MSAIQDALGMGQEDGSNATAEGSPKNRRGTIMAVILGLFIILSILCWPVTNAFMWPRPSDIRIKSAMADVKIALGHFRTEYESFPVSGPYDRKDVEMRSEGPMLAALIGEDPKLNIKKIRFLDPVPAREGKHGFVKDVGQWRMVDPWGESYYLALDVNMDNRIANPEAKPGNLSATIPAAINAPVILYSSGPDRDPKTWEDNVRSWR